MAIPLCGTFKYLVEVPKVPHDQTAPWPVQLDEHVPIFGGWSLTSRLVGLSPRLFLAVSGTSVPWGFSNPAVQTMRLTLVARGGTQATTSEVSFFIAKGLIMTLQRGDLLHMARTQCGGVGLSAIRDGRLVFGVGAIRAVPLGKDIRAECPTLKQAIERVCQKRHTDPEAFKQAIEIIVGAQAFTAYEGRSQLGEYQVSIMHGYQIDFPGNDECVSIARTDGCSLNDAEVSARLLDHRHALLLGPRTWLRKVGKSEFSGKRYRDSVDDTSPKS
jgi:hypothetical protein